MSDTPDVTTQKGVHIVMCQKAALPRTLMGGTEAMRAAGKVYLPQEPKEGNTAYENRLSRTTLHNCFAKAISALTGKLFAKPVVLSESTPDDIMKLLEDVDGQGGNGRDFNRFLSHTVEDGMVAGLTHVLVDMPPLPRDEEGKEVQLTIEEANKLGHRPKWAQYKMEALVNWRFGTDGKLDRVVLREVVCEPDGEWGEAEIEQYRVLYRGRWEIYRYQEVDRKKQWVKVKEGITPLDFIPLVTIYCAKSDAPMTVKAPLLENLAHLNVAHWQSSSDQRHILHVARVPLLFGTGWSDEDENKKDQEVGPNQLILQPQGATMEFVEHGGQAIKSGEDDLKRLEDQMAVAAMEPLVPRTGNQTATAKAIDTAEATSTLQDIAQGLKDAVEQLLVCTGAWYKIAPEQCGEATVHADFSLNLGDATAIQALGAARTLGDISREAHVAELRRRDILSSDYDPVADKLLLEQEQDEQMKFQAETFKAQGGGDGNLDTGL